MKIVVLGEPRGKQRPRATTIGGHARMYTPKETIEYENYVRACFSELKLNSLQDGPIRAVINAYFSIPDSYSKKRKQLATNNIERPTKKCDIDNIAKIILDALNKQAYSDDKNIVELVACKYYGEPARVEVELEEL